MRWQCIYKGKYVEWDEEQFALIYKDDPSPVQSLGTKGLEGKILTEHFTKVFRVILFNDNVIPRKLERKLPSLLALGNHGRFYRRMRDALNSFRKGYTCLKQHYIDIGAGPELMFPLKHRENWLPFKELTKEQRFGMSEMMYNALRHNRYNVSLFVRFCCTVAVLQAVQLSCWFVTHVFNQDRFVGSWRRYRMLSFPGPNKSRSV